MTLTTEQIHEAVRCLHSMGYSVTKGGREYSLPPPKVVVHFVGGPWAGQTCEVDRVVGPVFLVVNEVGNRYWLDTKSDPPTYYWRWKESDERG